MDYSSSDKLFSKKNLISYLILAILILAIPVAVKLVQTQQVLKSQAARGSEITFPDLKRDDQGNLVSTSNQIKIQLDSPFGPATPQLQSQ